MATPEQPRSRAGSRRTLRVRWAAFTAGLVHDLHRLKIPGTRRGVLPLNVRVIESHLRTMHAAFARHGISFWLRDGTALGAYRDGGVIPHDDDIDLGIWAAGAARLEPVLADLVKEGFVIYRRKEGIVCLIKDRETVEICISGVSPPQNEYIRVLEAFFRAYAPVTMLGLTFAVPARTEEYLEYCYGPDWRTPKFGAWWSNSCWRPAAEREQRARIRRPARDLAACRTSSSALPVAMRPPTDQPSPNPRSSWFSAPSAQASIPRARNVRANSWANPCTV